MSGEYAKEAADFARRFYQEQRNRERAEAPPQGTRSRANGADTSPPQDLQGLTGAELSALLKRSPPPRVFAGCPVAGNLTVYVGREFTGKSALMLWQVMARGAGVAPWEGAPELEAGRVLILAPDEAAAQLVRRLSSLLPFHPAQKALGIGAFEKLLERIEIVAPDIDLPDGQLDLARFADSGLAALRRKLDVQQQLGDPIFDVWGDAWADLLPVGESENSNEVATHVGGALQRLAVTTGASININAHAVRIRELPSGELDVRDLVRGAAALAAKARTVHALTEIKGLPHARLIRSRTNLGPTPEPLQLQVAGPKARPGELVQFVVADLNEAYPPKNYLENGVRISTNDLARRIFKIEPDEDGKKPEVTGTQRTFATHLRDLWEESSLVTVHRPIDPATGKVRSGISIDVELR